MHLTRKTTWLAAAPHLTPQTAREADSALVTKEETITRLRAQRDALLLDTCNDIKPTQMMKCTPTGVDNHKRWFWLTGGELCWAKNEKGSPGKGPFVLTGIEEQAGGLLMLRNSGDDAIVRPLDDVAYTTWLEKCRVVQLDAWLAKFGAQQLKPFLDELGAESLEDLQMLELEDIKSLGKQADETLKKLKAKKFMKAVAELAQKIETWELSFENVSRWTNEEMASACQEIALQELKGNEQLVYHYTDIASAKLITEEGSLGFRASEKGQGGGGFYVTKQGPH
eukprot:COSAG06_NODE_18471_length_886_cov_0.972046_1_plen_281_part_10